MALAVGLATLQSRIGSDVACRGRASQMVRRWTVRARSPRPLVTQFAVPSAPFGMVERPRLRERLRARPRRAGDARLRPGGQRQDGARRCGRARCRGPVAWVSLEPDDDEPGRLWDAVLTALHGGRRRARPTPRSPRWRRRCASRAPRSCRCSSTRSPSCRSRCARARRRARPALARAAWRSSRSSCCTRPPTLRLVLSARADPALPLHVLRVRGRLVEIRAADLAFTRPETAELLARARLDAAATTGARAARAHRGLGRRAAAGRAQPPGPRGRPSASSPSSPATTAWSATTCWPRCCSASRPKLRAFLLRTSIVDRVCGDLADALTGEGHGADTLAALERTNGFVIGVDGHARMVPLPPAVRASCCAPGPSASWPASCPRCMRARPAGTPSAAPARRRCGTRWRRRTGISRSRSSPSTGSSSTCAATRAAIRALVDRAAGRAPARRTPSCPPRWPAPRSTSATPTPPSSTSRTPSAAAGGLPSRAARRYLETMALARLAAARLEGDFEAALSAADELLAEAAGTRPRRRGPPGARARMLGETALWAHRLERARRGAAPRRHARARRRARLRAVSALSDLALLECRSTAGPAATGHAQRGDRARRAAWLGRRSRRPRARTPRWRWRAFFDLARTRPPSTSSAPPRRPPACASADVDFVLAHLGARMPGRSGAAREGAAPARRVRRHPSRHGARRLRAAGARRVARAPAVATGELDEADACSHWRRWREPWLAVDVADARGCGWPTASRTRRSSSSPRARRRQAGHPRRDRASSCARAARGRARRGRRARGAARALERALALAEHDAPPVAVPGGRAAHGRHAAPADPPGHRASRDRRRAARRVRRPRAGHAHGHAAARAAQRARAGDPALPADDALQPRDRRRAVRHDQHGQDAPALDLPQARRRAPARGGRARARPAAALARHAADAAGCSASPTSPNGSGSQYENRR